MHRQFWLIRTRYSIFAALLSALWYPVLLVPGMTRGWLLDKGFSWPVHVAMLVVAGLVVAHLFKPFILRADSFLERLWRAFCLPLIGTALYLIGVLAVMGVSELVNGGLMNWHDSLALMAWGLVSTVLSFYVVVPYGMLCQYVLEWADNTEKGS